MTDPIVARWAEAERILDEVLDLPDGDQAAAARARCGEDAELAAVVQRLLATTLDVDVSAPAALVASALAETQAAEALPASIGPFRVLRELGRGGMGRVVLALRDGLDGGPHVAIKMLDRAMARGDDRRRFDRERETLARLQHPHIARLFDGGVADDGTPYLVRARRSTSTAAAGLSTYQRGSAWYARSARLSSTPTAGSWCTAT